MPVRNKPQIWRTKQVIVKEWTTIYNSNTVQKNMAVAEITANKVDFKAQDDTRDIKKPFDNEKRSKFSRIQ